MSHKFNKTPSSLTNSFPVLVAFFADAAPRWPRHTTFENNELSAKSHMSYYHSTYALHFLCCINLLLAIKDTKFCNYKLRTNIFQVKKIDGLKLTNHPTYSSLFISIIGVLSTSVRDLSYYKPRRVTLFYIAQMDDCAKVLKGTN